jgi:hypothetical protein
MYQFILNMWVFGNITEDQVNSYVSKRFISKEQSQQILATPKEAE